MDNNEEKKVEVGGMFIQDNQDRRFGSDPQYIVMWAVPPQGGAPIPLMFTREDITDATARAVRNAEDVPELGSIAPIGKFDEE